MNYRPCEHIASSATLQPFAAITYGEIKAALCSVCFASEIAELSAVLTPEEIGAAVTLHAGAKTTREPKDDCITLTNDLLRSDAAGDRARAEVKRQRLEAQRLRTLGRRPVPGVVVVSPAQREITLA